ncbi:MAG: site-2 protease family protein [Acidimicrobiales bacterium]|nr:site-2 protease family protein [Acidimicrobiales bacterium]
MTDTPVIDEPAPPATRSSEPRGEIAGESWRVVLLALATVALGVFAGRGWLFIIAALTVMIFLHELGHFLTAKWSGMKVTEFFLFFGPKLWSFRRGETEYGIKLIPIGAYVRIIGMNNLDETPPEDEPRTYRQQSFPKRMLVITAGSMMHFVQALVLFFLVFSVVGVPGESRLAERFGGRELDPSEWIVGTVGKGTAADRAGIQPGDDIVSLNGERLGDILDIGPIIEDRAGDRLPLVVDRDGERLELTATIGSRVDEDGRTAGFLGVSEGYPKLPSVTTDPLTGSVEAVKHTGDVMWQTLRGLGSFVTGGLGSFADNVADGTSAEGPAISGGSSEGNGGRSITRGDEDRLMSMVGVARWGASASEDGVADFLLLLALINVSIGMLNLLPLLPLDGGHAAVAIYERIRSTRGRRHMADVSRLLPFTYAVMLLGFMIMVSAVYLDIVDPIGLG